MNKETEERLREEWEKTELYGEIKRDCFFYHTERDIADFWLSKMKEEIEKAVNITIKANEVMNSHPCKAEIEHLTGMEQCKNCEHLYEHLKHICRLCGQHDGYSRSCGIEFCLCND